MQAGTVLSVAWKHLYGHRRVVCFAPGHVAAGLEAAQMREILRSGLLRAAR